MRSRRKPKLSTEIARRKGLTLRRATGLTLSTKRGRKKSRRSGINNAAKKKATTN